MPAFAQVATARETGQFVLPKNFRSGEQARRGRVEELNNLGDFQWLEKLPEKVPMVGKTTQK